MNTTISLDESVLKSLQLYTQAKTAQESIYQAIKEFILYKQQQNFIDTEHEAWLGLSGKNLENAYSDEEEDYPLASNKRDES
jgi:hypothetical protein